METNRAPKKNTAGVVKSSDIRFTTAPVYAEIKKLTGVDWRKAYDPTPKNAKGDTLEKKWKGPNIFMNPPFSKSKKFVGKLMDEMESNKGIKKALIILPWYQVESKKERVTQRAAWFAKERRRMGKFNYKQFHLGNQPFYNPIDKKEILVRVYAIYLKR